MAERLMKMGPIEGKNRGSNDFGNFQSHVSRFECGLLHKLVAEAKVNGDNPV
jgi:hypothetical protein